MNEPNKYKKNLEGVLWLKISKTTKLSATSLWPFTNDKKRECKNIYSKRQNVWKMT